MAYNDSFYPAKTFTLDDARVLTSGGACPFQATGTINGEDFYFRLRHGGASLDIGKNFEGYINASTSEYGHLDGACSDEEFEMLFNKMIESYVPLKRPCTDPEYATYSFADAHIWRNDIANGGTMNGKLTGYIFTSFQMEVLNGIATLETPDGYVRSLNVDEHLGEYCQSSIPENKIQEVFNILIADYS